MLDSHIRRCVALVFCGWLATMAVRVYYVSIYYFMYMCVLFCIVSVCWSLNKYYDQYLHLSIFSLNLVAERDEDQCYS